MDTDGLRKVGTRIGLALAAFAALPAAADAATVATDGTTRSRFTAARARPTSPRSPPPGTDIVFTDPGASSIKDGDGRGGCSVSGGVATCPLASLRRHRT